jgi:hypothetical protein
MAKVFVDQFIASYASEPEIIILNPDDTNSFTYGQQELTLFNNYYGDYCYMPLHIYEDFSGKMISTILKPGRRNFSCQSVPPIPSFSCLCFNTFSSE